MRDRMREVRDTLAAADNRVGGLDLARVGKQNGLFSILGMTPEQVLQIRKDHGIYMAGTSRINVAGLTSGNIGKFIDALADVAG